MPYGVAVRRAGLLESPGTGWRLRIPGAHCGGGPPAPGRGEPAAACGWQPPAGAGGGLRVPDEVLTKGLGWQTVTERRCRA